ncbi:MAG TPA: hypothetical protein VJB08_04565 [Candidatus Nanoarchaeia archaeon]|nr:hypothetical protein [Candidatus Nanoarchaeia archaeon]
MDPVSSLRWIEKQHLGYYCRPSVGIFERVLKTCLPKGESMLIISDFGLPHQNIAAEISYAYYLAGQKLGLNPGMILQSQKTRGQEADRDVIKALEALPSNSLVVVNISDRLGSMGRLGKSFRSYCKAQHLPFISMPSLGYLDTQQVPHLLAAIDIDYKALSQKHDSVKADMDSANTIRITTDAGTDAVFDVEGVISRKADGLYGGSRLGGNLPAGEVYLAPRNAEGRIVVDASSRNRHSTRLTGDEPIVLEIRNGSVVRVSGGKNAEILERSLLWAEKQAVYPDRVRRVAELGIGLNPRAKVIGSTILDEKAAGTAHIAIGSNHWFGGDNSTIIHLDQVFFKPEIEFLERM